MGRLTGDARIRAEQDIRAAMDRLLRGDLPSGGRCDFKTLADEFHHRLAALRDAGRRKTCPKR